MEELIKNLFDTTVYLIAIFDEKDRIVYSNDMFVRYFGNVENSSDILNKFKMRQSIDVKKELFYGKRVRTILKSDENQDHIFKFEISGYDGYKLAIGIKLEYEDIINLGEDMLAKDFVKVEDMAKIIEKNELNQEINSYATIVFDGEMIVRYVSSNMHELFGDKVHVGQRLKNSTGEGYEDFVMGKMKMVDIFGVITIDYSGNFASLSKHDSKYYVLNIYPYSKETHDKFEELQSLSRKIRQLEIELNNKNKLIKVQKMIFENIAAIDDMTKLYNRMSFFKHIESEILKAKQLKYPLAVTILSLENLKDINLSMGTKYGDEALREIAISMKNSSRRGLDIGYRLSSHEFSIISLDSDKDKTEQRFENLKDLSIGEIGMDMQISIFELDLSMDIEEIISEINKMTHNI